MARRTSVATWLAIAALGFSVAPNAATVTVTTTGTVTEVSYINGSPLLCDGSTPCSAFPFQAMNVGDPFSVSISYDDFDSLPDSPDDAFFQNVTSYSITSGGQTIIQTSPGFGSVASISNDRQPPSPPGDRYALYGYSRSFGTRGQCQSCFGAERFELIFEGDTSPLTNDLPVAGDPGQLEGWDPARSYFFYSVQSTQSPSYGLGSFRGQLALVPVPGAALLFLSALGAVTFAGRRRPSG